MTNFSHYERRLLCSKHRRSLKRQKKAREKEAQEKEGAVFVVRVTKFIKTSYVYFQKSSVYKQIQDTGIDKVLHDIILTT